MSKPQPRQTTKAKLPAVAPAAVIPSELPDPGGLRFDLGSNLQNRPDAPMVEVSTPTAQNASEMFKRFQETGSVEIEASALMPGIACPFTRGCAEKGGKVRILSDTTSPKQMEDGRTAVQRVQQFHCRTCGCVAKGVKPVGGVAIGGPRLFNRLTGKGE